MIASRKADALIASLKSQPYPYPNPNRNPNPNPSSGPPQRPDDRDPGGPSSLLAHSRAQRPSRLRQQWQDWEKRQQLPQQQQQQQRRRQQQQAPQRRQQPERSRSQPRQRQGQPGRQQRQQPERARSQPRQRQGQGPAPQPSGQDPFRSPLPPAKGITVRPSDDYRTRQYLEEFAGADASLYLSWSLSEEFPNSPPGMAGGLGRTPSPRNELIHWSQASRSLSLSRSGSGDGSVSRSGRGTGKNARNEDEEAAAMALERPAGGRIAGYTEAGATGGPQRPRQRNGPTSPVGRLWAGVAGPKSPVGRLWAGKRSGASPLGILWAGGRAEREDRRGEEARIGARSRGASDDDNDDDDDDDDDERMQLAMQKALRNYDAGRARRQGDTTKSWQSFPEARFSPNGGGGEDEDGADVEKGKGPGPGAKGDRWGGGGGGKEGKVRRTPVFRSSTGTPLFRSTRRGRSKGGAGGRVCGVGRWKCFLTVGLLLVVAGVFGTMVALGYDDWMWWKREHAAGSAPPPELLTAAEAAPTLAPAPEAAPTLAPTQTAFPIILSPPEGTPRSTFPPPDVPKAQLNDECALTRLTPGDEVFFRSGADEAATKRFGHNVAVSDRTAIVGAPGSEGAPGSVHVYKRDEGGFDWHWWTSLQSPEARPDDQFGKAVSIDGDVIVAGSMCEGDDGSRHGCAFVFEHSRSGGTWDGRARLVPGGGTGGIGIDFADSLAISRDTIMIGERRSSFEEEEARSGAVFVFERSSATGQWLQTDRLMRGSDGDRFGSSVDLFGDVALVGAPRNDDLGRDAGAVHVYERQRFDGFSAGWFHVQTIKDGNGKAGDGFGSTVAISWDDVAVVGAPGQGEGGLVHVYAKSEEELGLASSLRRTSPSWTLASTLGPTSSDLSSDGTSSARFGNSVDLDGDVIAVGAEGESIGGAVYVFDRVTFGGGGGHWQRRTRYGTRDGEDGARFGRSVAISDSTVVVGALATGSLEGSAHIVEVC